VQAYFDESGHFADTDFVCLTGYIAEDAQWQAFCDAWKVCLRSHKVSSIHMKDFMRRQGQYVSLGWTDAERDDALSEFVNIIRANTWGAFAVGFDTKHFRTLPGLLQAKVGDPHMFCFQRLMRRVVDTLTASGYEPTVSVMFDDHQLYSRECYSHWSELRARQPEMRRRIPCISFGDDEIYFPLQGADILAWLSNRWLRDGRDTNRVSRHLGELLSEPLHGNGFALADELWDKTELERQLPAMKGGQA
jgi:hypothetical protein